MAGRILLSTAYLPPVEYFSLMSECDEVFIEYEENYLKQSYRNRCHILTPGGVQRLSVPVYLGSFHKTHIRDIRIDYSKRWQQIHIGALHTAYRSSPFYEFYEERLTKVIQSNHEFLLDLNAGLLEVLNEILGLRIPVNYTSEFTPVKHLDNDFRYILSPKKGKISIGKPYPQVFRSGNEFVAGLSIVDLIFNTGPDASSYL